MTSEALRFELGTATQWYRPVNRNKKCITCPHLVFKKSKPKKPRAVRAQCCLWRRCGNRFTTSRAHASPSLAAYAGTSGSGEALICGSSWDHFSTWRQKRSSAAIIDHLTSMQQWWKVRRQRWISDGVDEDGRFTWPYQFFRSVCSSASSPPFPAPMVAADWLRLVCFLFTWH